MHSQQVVETVERIDQRLPLVILGRESEFPYPRMDRFPSFLNPVRQLRFIHFENSSFVNTANEVWEVDVVRNCSSQSDLI
jgi:hypothetical protein